jgi:hypothetical protein
MRTLCKLLGLISLLLILVFPLLYAMGPVSLDSLKMVIFVATLVWFGTAPFWIGDKQA